MTFPKVLQTGVFRESETVSNSGSSCLSAVREGTKLQIKIPAKLAYGRVGVSSMGIPPNADLIFKVEVLKVT